MCGIFDRRERFGVGRLRDGGGRRGQPIGPAASKDQCFLYLSLLGELLPDRPLFRLPSQAFFRTLASTGVFFSFAPCTEGSLTTFSYSPLEIGNFCLQGCSGIDRL